jgi:hypothetical protein
LVGASVAAVLLAGCAGVMRVDSQVKTYAQWPSGALPAGKVHYRFERLPSQTSAPAARPQADLEGWVAAALARAGWVPSSEGDPHRWLVQVTSRTEKLPRAPWERPDDNRWAMGGLWAGSGGYKGGFFVMEIPYYLRHLSVVVLDTQSAQVVFETTASHDGRWNDSPGLWQAMADAALDGFPQPGQPQRQVNIDIPR